MSDLVKVAQTQNGEGLPVGRLNAATGIRLAATPGASSAPHDLSEGVYMLSATVPLFFSIASSPVAGDLPGSLLLGPGGILSIAVEDGDRIAVRAVDQNGALLAVQLMGA